MLVPGRIFSSMGVWIVNIESLEISVSGKTRIEAKLSLKEKLKELSFNPDDFEISQETREGVFYITSDSKGMLSALVLKCLRLKAGKSLQEVADILEFSSRSSYYKYETGHRSMSFDQFSRIVTALSGKNLILSLKGV